MIVDIFCVVLLSSTTESIGCSIGEERIVLTDSLIPGQAYLSPNYCDKMT